jgi:hypothetical protein
LPEVVETLCRLGADMSAATVDSNPPLWIALDSSQEDLASILVRLVLLLKDLKNIGLGLKDEWLGNCLFSRNVFFVMLLLL